MLFRLPCKRAAGGVYLYNPPFSPAALPVMTDETPNNPPPAKTAAPPRKRRWLRRLALTLLLLVAVLAAALVWLLGSHSGLRFAAFKIPSWFGVGIRAEKLQGTVWGGFQADGLTVQTEGADVAVSRAVFAWKPNELWQRHLHISRIEAGDIDIQTKPTPPKPESKEPFRLPENLNLPLSIDIDSIRAGKITIGKKHSEILGGLQAGYHYNHLEHLLDIPSLKTPWADNQGRFSLTADSPFALQGTLDSKGELEGIAIDNHLLLSGTLENTVLNTYIIGKDVSLHADTRVKPFADDLGDMIGHIKLEGSNINPKAFMAGLPAANLTFKASVLPRTGGGNIALDGDISLLNSKPAAIDNNGIPVQELTANFTIDQNGLIDVAAADLALIKNGKISLAGTVDTEKERLKLNTRLSTLTAADLLATPLAGTLNGSIAFSGSFAEPQAKWQLNAWNTDSTGNVKLATDTQNRQRTVIIENGRIAPKDGGSLQLSGSLALFKEHALQAQLRSEHFNPAKIDASWPAGNINGSIKLDGRIADQVFHSDLQFAPSQLSGANLSGGGKVSYEQGYLSRADLSVRLGSNLIDTKGSFGRRGSVLRLNIDAPNLAQFGFGLEGLLNAKGTLTSTDNGWTKIDAALDGQARSLKVPGAVQIGRVDFRLHGSPDPQRPLDIDLKGQNILAGSTDIDQVDLTLKGTLRRHNIRGTGSLKIDGKPLKAQLAADGGLNEQNQWHGSVGTLNTSGALNLSLQNPLTLEAGKERVSLSSARWRALGGSLNLERFVWDKKSGLSAKGSADNLHFAELHNFYTPPVEHNLVLAGNWDLSYSQSPNGYLNIKQQGGDITLPTKRKQALNLSNFVLNTNLTAGGIRSRFSGDTRYGKAAGEFDILQVFGGGRFIEAPIQGAVRLDAQELQTLRNLLPAGQTIRGSLKGEARISGRLNDPKFDGTITGEDLFYRNRDVGVVLADGKLQSRLQGMRWIIDSLTFRNGGTVTLTGSAGLTEGKTDVKAKVVFDRYRLLDKPSRRLTVSGSADAGYDGSLFTLDGSLKTDEGRFGFQESSMPELDDDVVILGEAEKPPATAFPMNLNLVFDLNDAFRFSGSGLNVTLGGKLNISARPGSKMQAVGSVNVIKGRYKAYGQDLVIKKGVVSFVGPLDKPTLNIRAERRNSPVGAGVEVLGSLDKPRVSLVANEAMSEKDKLSWLILNRGSSGSSADEAALATAASAWLAGRVNDKIGLVDDFGLTSRQTRNAQTGEMNPAQQILTFGKQLTQNLYLGYEVGLGTASQSVKLVYQFSRSFQAVIRGGTESSGGEVKYIHRFD